MVTTVTKSVGTTGRDYSTVAAAVAALPSNLVTADQAWVFELYNDSEFNENLTLSGHTTDATRTITFRPGSGQGFGDHASKLTNALRYNQSNGVGIRLPGAFVSSCWVISDQYVTIDGLQFSHRDAAESKHLINITAANVTLINCIVQNDTAFNTGGGLVSITAASKAVNCLGIEGNPTQSNRGGFSPQDNGAALINCLTIRTALTGNGSSYYRDYATPLIRNCAAFGWQKFGKDTTGASGSGYNATDVASGNVPGSNNVYSLTPSSQLTSVTNGSVDARVKTGSSLINAGTRDQTYTADLDIVKSARSTSTPTIGPWEYGAAPPSQVAGTFALDDFVLSGAFATGALSQLAGNITMDDFVLSGTLGLLPGRIDTDPFKNWTGTLLPGVTVPSVVFVKLDRTVPLALTNQITAGDGVMTVQNAALVPSTYYIMVSFNADGSQVGAELVRAT